MAKRGTPIIPSVPWIRFVPPVSLQEVEFWSLNNDWDISERSSEEDRKYLSWGTQTLLGQLYHWVLDPQRSENERRLLSCWLFIHLLNGYYASGLVVGPTIPGKNFKNTHFWRQYQSKTRELPPAPWLIPIQEEENLFRELPAFTMEERDKIAALFKTRRMLLESWKGGASPWGKTSSGIPEAENGGEFSSVEPIFVLILLKYVWDMETQGEWSESSQSTKSLAILTGVSDAIKPHALRFLWRCKGWSVGTFRQINSDKNVFLHPFGKGHNSIMVLNYRQNPFLLPIV